MERIDYFLLLVHLQTPNGALFCAGYEGSSRPERVHFWVGLIAAIARAETRFNTHDTFTESFREKGADSPLVVSRGLLQLSFPGDRDHYHCELPNAESLYDPAVNLTCGVGVCHAPKDG